MLITSLFPAHTLLVPKKNMHFGKCSQISKILLFLFLNKMLVYRAVIHKVVVRIANREDPDQTASSEAV